MIIIDNITKPNDWNAISEKRVDLNTTKLSSNSKSINSLKESLSSSSKWNETFIVESWILNNGDVNDLLTGSNLADIYSYIIEDYSYIAISNSFSKCLKDKITCQHIFSAANVAKTDDGKVSILNAYASNCIDKSNAQSTFSNIGLDEEKLSMLLTSYK